MIVMKFGGTSVKDADAIRNATDIINHEITRNPLVVVSACAGVTDTLITIARNASGGDKKAALEDVSVLQLRHFEIAENLLSGKNLNSLQPVLKKQFNNLELLVKGVSILQELTPRVLDHFMSFGEQWSSLLLYYTLLERNLTTSLVDAKSIIITDNNFTKAGPLFDLTEMKVKKQIEPLRSNQRVLITQGFIGATKDGIVTTLGRGGSDYSAAIFGSLLNAEEIQIWTDVDGILTANPGIVSEARPVGELTFEEAAELAYFGAKVLHPSTILPAVDKNIPVRVLNSRIKDFKGTLITTKPDRGSEEPHADTVVKSIAHKSGITVIRIHSTRMLMAHGFLARVFEVFARSKKSVDVIATSEVGISLTVDDEYKIEDIVRELKEIADVSVERNRTVCCVVGENLKRTKGIASRTFTALAKAGVNVEMISHGGSEINLTFVISDESIPLALKSLHDEFFKNVR